MNLTGIHINNRTDDDVVRIDFGSGRMLTAYPLMVHDQFPNLHTVVVLGNLQVQRFALDRCERLTHFAFEGPANSIITLYNGVFGNCNSMREIRIQRTVIASIEVDVFKDTPNLQRLIISGNRIQSLKIGTFDGLNQLEHLDVERNSIITFEPQIFHGIQNLRVLMCGQGLNRFWPAGLISNLPSLVEIDVEFSGLQTIFAGAFGDLPSLEIIRIHGELRRLNVNIFSVPLPSLHTFDINDNLIDAMHRDFFQRIPAVRNVIAKHNVCINRIFQDILAMRVVLDAFEICFSNF